MSPLSGIGGSTGMEEPAGQPQSPPGISRDDCRWAGQPVLGFSAHTSL